MALKTNQHLSARDGRLFVYADLSAIHEEFARYCVKHGLDPVIMGQTLFDEWDGETPILGYDIEKCELAPFVANTNVVPIPTLSGEIVLDVPPPRVKNTLPNTSYPRDKLALEYLTDEKRKRIEYDVHHLVELCYACSLAAGWHTDENGEPIRQNHGERIALMHSELSEALEAIRTDARSTKTPDFSGVEEELADAVIRIADYAGRNGLDLGGAIAAKLVYNAGRADHKRAARNAPGGKKF